MNKKKEKSIKLNLISVLIMFATIPLIIGGLACTIYLVESAKNQVESATNNSMLSIIEETGKAFDYYKNSGEDSVIAFTKSPVITEYLKNPNDAKLAAQAQAYTVDFFNSMDGWEGLYIADWSSKVLTHPAEPVIGKVMREGERLEELQNAMTSSDGIYNAGIITSPASGKLIISMYVPVYDNAKPIGYVGAGIFISNMLDTLSDVSALELDSAYTYVVSSEGVMLYHPDETKIGNPVENAAVKMVVGELEAGKHPTSDCVMYEYKGTNKFAAYCVGENEDYIAVLTADQSEVVKKASTMTASAFGIFVVVIILFVVIAVVVAKIIEKPLAMITKAIAKTSEGYLDADTNVRSNLKETTSLIESTQLLQKKLNEIIGDVKKYSGELIDGAEKVNTLATDSAQNSAQILNVADELAQGATSMATSVQAIDNQAVQMGCDIDDISHNAGVLVGLSNDIKDANANATEYIYKVSESSKQSVEAVKDIAKQIEETNEAVLSVQEAVSVIQAIAAQTNLLALNANIEAARAGEAGRGFAVVASEIGNLSTQSNASASQISEIVSDIIAKSGRSVKLSAEVVESINEEQSFIVDTQQKFEVLNSNIEKSLVEIDSISKKVESLSIAKEEIISSVSELGAVSEENAASTEEVAASITTINSDIENISANSEETNTIADALNENVAYFK